MQAPSAPAAPDLRAGYASLVTAVLGTSLSSLFYKLSFATGLHPLWVNVLRMALTLLLMLPLTLLSRKRRQAFRQVSAGAFWLSVLSGTFLAVHFSAWVIALDRTDAFAASAIWGTYLLMTAALSALLLKEKTSKGALAGLMIATAGVLVCNLQAGPGRLSGNLMALLAALMQALYTLCGRKVRERMDANTYTSIVYTVALLWMIVAVLVPGVPATGLQTQNLLWALGLAVFSTLLGHTMMNVSLKYFKAPTVSAVMLITVVTAPLGVLLVLGEVPTRYTLLGGCIILIGLGWYLTMERRDSRRVRAAIR